MAREYPPIMKTYKDWLKSRGFARGGKTVDTYERDANRVFEALIACFPEDILDAAVKMRFKGNYRTTIKYLKQLVTDRPR